jgi:hypothetical protein
MFISILYIGIINEYLKEHHVPVLEYVILSLYEMEVYSLINIIIKL